MMAGILVGCDRNQEWLLPWWWKHYSETNSYPVAFVDFGMSEKGRDWCQERGFYSALSLNPSLQTISAQNKAQWEARAGEGIWSFRAAWFKKPLACLQSPFSLTCWLDLDCEVKGDLAPLFNTLGYPLAIVRESEDVQIKDRKQPLAFPDEVTYNSGVVVFHRGAEILIEWAKLSLEENHQFMGDQNALSRLIYLHKYPVLELPAVYNWKMDQGPNPNALILHYIAAWKLKILDRFKSFVPV